MGLVDEDHGRDDRHDETNGDGGRDQCRPTRDVRRESAAGSGHVQRFHEPTLPLMTAPDPPTNVPVANGTSLPPARKSPTQGVAVAYRLSAPNSLIESFARRSMSMISW